jgi:hypothetical protein
VTRRAPERVVLLTNARGTPLLEYPRGRSRLSMGIPDHMLCSFARVLREAKLPGHFTPHSLRHSFASLLLSDGVSPAYVQRQLGHSSIKLTVDLYGKWLPMANKAAVDRLDDAAPSQVVAEAVATGSEGGMKLGRSLMISPVSRRRRKAQPPKSFFSDSRKPPTSGPCSSPEDTRWYSSRSSRCFPVSFRGTSTTTV